MDSVIARKQRSSATTEAIPCFQEDHSISRRLLRQDLDATHLDPPRNDRKMNYAILTIFQKSVKPIGFHSKPETVFRTPNSAAGWYSTA